MRHITSCRLAYLVTGILSCGWTNAARAGKAVADGTDGYGVSKNNAGATTALFVSTYTGGPAEATRSYNTGQQFFATGTRTAGVDNPTIFNYNNAAPGTTLNNAFVGGPFSTILGKNNLPKPTVGRKDDSPTATGVVTYSLQSNSGPYYASAGDDSESIHAFARKNAVNKVAGAAGSIAYDPFTLNSSSGPTYAYAPNIGGSLQLETPTESGEIVFFATDDYVYPHGLPTNNLDFFVENGQPLGNTLWTLDIKATGPITSISNLSIAFNLNPAAVNELNLSSTPGYSAGYNSTQLAALVDNYVQNNLMNGGITLAPDGTASLTAFSPFAPGTLYTPAFGSTEQNANGNEASITDIPEPIGSSLLLIVFFTGLTTRRRRYLSRNGH